jgi:drug/metabolite transporter (DMT)-like permease
MSIAAVLALVAAFGYGLGDFIAGMLSRRVHFAVVAVLAGVGALVTSVAVVGVLPPVEPTREALLWGAASGIGTAMGTLALFRGLGRGRMGIVAPVSGVTAAAIPVMVGVLLGDRPGLIAWVGVALAVPAIWLVSGADHDDGAEVGTASVPSGPRIATSVSDGILAGIGFAVLFIGLDFAGDGSGLWPVLANELAGLAVFGIALLAFLPRIERRRPAARDLAGGALVGVIGAGASAAYFLAATAGLLSIVTVLASLYPAVTVILAIVIAHEAVGRRQALGLGLVCLAIALIVLG